MYIYKLARLKFLPQNADTDFCSQQANLTFTMDNVGVSQCVHIQTKNDTCLENTERFFVRLSSSDSSVVIKNELASIEIEDDDSMFFLFF